jgi:hypothetical protein
MEIVPAAGALVMAGAACLSARLAYWLWKTGDTGPHLAPLADALRRPLNERFTYGEIAPARLARAAAILALRPKVSEERFGKISVGRQMHNYRVPGAELGCDGAKRVRASRLHLANPSDPQAVIFHAN